MFPIDFYKTRISHFLRGTRKRLGITQKELASRMVCSEAALSRFENNVGFDYDLENLLKFARLAEMSLTDFVAYLEEVKNVSIRKSATPWGDEIIEAFRRSHGNARQAFFADVLLRLSKSELSKNLLIASKLSHLDSKQLKFIDHSIEMLVRERKKK